MQTSLPVPSGHKGEKGDQGMPGAPGLDNCARVSMLPAPSSSQEVAWLQGDPGNSPLPGGQPLY